MTPRWPSILTPYPPFDRGWGAVNAWAPLPIPLILILSHA